MNLEKQIIKVIRDTCTHWICADESELDKVSKELKKEFEIIINLEVNKRLTIDKKLKL